MGACCTKDYMYGRGYTTCDKDERDSNGGDDGEEVRQGEDGATVRIRGSSAFSSMFTQRGRKGINQDAMTVWEVKKTQKEESLYLCFSINLNTMDDLQKFHYEMIFFWDMISVSMHSKKVEPKLTGFLRGERFGVLWSF